MKRFLLVLGLAVCALGTSVVAMKKGDGDNQQKFYVSWNSSDEDTFYKQNLFVGRYTGVAKINIQTPKKEKDITIIINSSNDAQRAVTLQALFKSFKRQNNDINPYKSVVSKIKEERKEEHAHLPWIDNCVEGGMKEYYPFALRTSPITNEYRLGYYIPSSLSDMRPREIKGMSLLKIKIPNSGKYTLTVSDNVGVSTYKCNKRTKIIKN